MGFTVLLFAAELQEVRTTRIFSDFWERTGASFRRHVCGRGKKVLKIRFYRIYIEISQLGRNVIKMALEWKSKWVSRSLTSIIEVLREEVELSNTRTAYVMHISQHIESHFGKKQPVAKILIAFLFS